MAAIPVASTLVAGPEHVGEVGQVWDITLVWCKGGEGVGVAPKIDTPKQIYNGPKGPSSEGSQYG